MRNARIRIVAFALALTLAALAPARGADDQEIKFSDCPAVVQKTFREEAKGAKIDTVSKETEDGVTTYYASVAIGVRNYTIGVAEDGTLAEVSLAIDEDPIQFADCPAPVQKTFREESKDAKIGDVTKELKLGIVIYEAHVDLNGKKYAIKVADDGTLTEKTLFIEEEDIDIADCPPAVQKTLREHSRRGDPSDVTRSSGIGGYVYQAAVEINGKTYNLEVAADGTLISMSLDEGD